MKIENTQLNYTGRMVEHKNKAVKPKSTSANIEAQKLELVKLRIRNKFYEREDILVKVVQEMYEHDVRYK